MIFVTRLFIGNLTEIGVPLFKQKRKVHKERLRIASGKPLPPLLSVAETECIMLTYDSTFNDYSEMVIQYGYVMLFAVAFPFAPAMALVNNYFEIRVDAAKLCAVSRRPVPAGAEDIGSWHMILNVISSIAVVTNAGTVLFTSDFFDDQRSSHYLSPVAKLWAFILAVQSIALFKFCFSLLVDDIPADVAVQMKRQEFFVRKLVNFEPDEEDLDDDVDRASMELGDDQIDTNIRERDM